MNGRLLLRSCNSRSCKVMQRYAKSCNVTQDHITSRKVMQRDARSCKVMSSCKASHAKQVTHPFAQLYSSVATFWLYSGFFRQLGRGGCLPPLQHTIHTCLLWLATYKLRCHKHTRTESVNMFVVYKPVMCLHAKARYI